MLIFKINQKEDAVYSVLYYNLGKIVLTPIMYVYK
jgi:hypothetical protein